MLNKQGKAARKRPGAYHARNVAGNFLAFIDEQIAIAREDIKRARHKLAVLEELRADYSEKPSSFSTIDGNGLPPRQLLASQAIATFLKNKKDPVPTKALLEMLAERGIRFGGQQPRNTLSVLLSRSKRFVAHGRRGWTLTDVDQE